MSNNIPLPRYSPIGLARTTGQNEAHRQTIACLFTGTSHILLVLMDHVMATCAKSYEICFIVCATQCMSFYMVNFQMTGIGLVPFSFIPTAFRTRVLIAPQNVAPDFIWNDSVMCWALPIGLKNVNAYVKFRLPGGLSYDWPSLFRS